MKTTILRIMLCLCLLALLSSTHAGALEPAQTVAFYLDALKRGNIEHIQTSIAGELYKEQKVLLEENVQYPAFLQKNYANATFRLENTHQPSPDRAVVNVTIYFADGSQSPTVFHLKRASVDHIWRIVKEVTSF